MAQPNNRRLASLLALLAVIAVLVMVFKLGKMSGSTGRSLKSSTGSASGFNAAKIDTLSWSPRVFHYHGFLSEEECNHIIKLELQARKRAISIWMKNRSLSDLLASDPGSTDLERSQVVGKDGKSVTNSHRTSYGTFMTKYMTDPVLAGLTQKIAEWTFLPVENGEIFYLLRYENGQEYKPHTDWFRRDDDGQHFIGGAGQRTATVLMYLSDVDEGGETYFPKADLQVRPKKGDAVLFWNQTPDHVDDDMSLHGSKPVLAGTKWSLTRWIREKSMNRFHEK